jgi:PPOX class probable F420-dependent enzyme
VRSAERPNIDQTTRDFITEHRVARLATASTSARPSVVPICYVLDGENIYSPLDEKPKSVEVRRLKRVRNIVSNPQVSLLIDDYSEDWTRLAWVLLGGAAELIEPGDSRHARAVRLLRQKYPQYEAMAIDRQAIIKLTIQHVKRWSAAKEKGDG